MRRSRKAALIPVLLIFITAVLASAPSVAQASRPTLSQAVDILLKQGYAQRAERHICGLGDGPLGFHTGGSPADLQTGLYWAAQMRLAGVKNVHLEPITMDAWEFRGASA